MGTTGDRAFLEGAIAVLAGAAGVILASRLVHEVEPPARRPAPAPHVAEGDLFHFLGETVAAAPRVVPAAGGESRPFCATPPPTRGGGVPMFSPDGEHVAYTDVAPYQRLVVVDRACRRTRIITEAGPHSYLRTPVWSLDGKSIGWTEVTQQITGHTPNPPTTIFAVAYLEEPLRTRTVAVVDSRSEGAFSPDLRTLVYVSNDWAARGVPRGELVEVAADGTRRLLTTEAASVRDPAFSPDGTSVVYVRERSEHAEVAVVSSAGGVSRTVVDARDDAIVGDDPRRALLSSPRFSPDGARIAFEDSDYVFVVTRLGAVENMIRARCPRFSPDGTHLAMVEMPAVSSSPATILVAEIGKPPVAVGKTSSCAAFDPRAR